MEQTEANVDWAMAKLEAFESFPGAPKTRAGIEAMAKQFLRIVHNTIQTHPKLGTVNDADWLIDTLLSAGGHFPIPIVMRRVYTDYFPAADGIEVSQLPDVD